MSETDEQLGRIAVAALNIPERGLTAAFFD
jgi:hypothetical protein